MKKTPTQLLPTDLIIRLDVDREVMQFFASTNRATAADGLSLVFEAPQDFLMFEESLEKGIGLQVLSYLAVSHKQFDSFSLKKYRENAFDD
jgi:hypothetical protein